MSYYISKASMRNDRNERYNCEWRLGTLRVLYCDERDCWGVTEPNDDWYGNALGWKDGEIFDGSAWKPLCEWWPVIEHRQVVAVERRAALGVTGRCNCSGIGHNGVSPTCPIHAGVALPDGGKR